METEQFGFSLHIDFGHWVFMWEFCTAFLLAWLFVWSLDLGDFGDQMWEYGHPKC